MPDAIAPSRTGGRLMRRMTRDRLSRPRETPMRTMLDIDDDVLAAARDLARRERTTTGKLVSEVMREALRVRSRTAPADGPRRVSHVHGFDPIPAGGAVVTNEFVNELREEAGV